jgi:CheY-like chemotaxis protein
LIRRSLDDCGATVTRCNTTDEGLAAFTTDRPDLVISDSGSAGRNGDEFIRRLRLLEDNRLSFTPAAALTATARPEDHRRALLAGFQAHIAKPVDALELVVILASLVGKNRLR